MGLICLYKILDDLVNFAHIVAFPKYVILNQVR